MLIFNWHRDALDESDRVDAAFARYDSAQLRAGTAGNNVKRVADAQTTRLKSDQACIRERTAEQQAKVHAGQTSGIVHLVEGALRSIEPRRNVERKGDQ